MSAAHTCFRSALSQAFRPNSCGIAAPCSVAAFLVPALGRSSKRSFTSGKRRPADEQPRLQPSVEETEDSIIRVIPPKPKQRIQSCIPYPPLEARGDVKPWLEAIEPFLPSHLRQETSDKPEKPTTSLDFALLVNKAQDASIDILGYLGVEVGKWQTVIWIVKKLTEDGKRSQDLTAHLEQYANAILQGEEHRSLKELTESPLRLQRTYPNRKLQLTLDDMTSAPESIRYSHAIVKQALGQLWRSLANMIMAAAEQSSGEQDTIMPHVLEMIAYLHHLGLMPDSVYTYRNPQDKHAFQQPPTLHMLSSKILTALSDATWNAHEASVKTAKDRANAQYFLGHEIPGSRYKVKVTEVSPELWLELVLWSCLHGGWTLDGTAILEKLAAKEGQHSWALISWREIMEAEQKKTPAPTTAWGLFPMNGDAAASAEDRAKTRRTISSEIVTGFVDGLVDQMRLGVGARGATPESLVASIKTLKGFLDKNNLSLGSSAWDSVMARLIESGGFVPEKRPELLLRVFELAPGFGGEVGAANASASANTEVPYFFEPTTIPLSFLHRAMRAFISNGDIKGAMTTLSMLQEYTDDNKQKSVQEFFNFLRNSPQLRPDQPFTSHLPPVEFPAFDIKLPLPLLARLLDLVTESKQYDLGRWLLFSEDLDGPLIDRELQIHRNISASVVRFGTMAGENELVLDIVKKVGAWNEKYQQHRMPAEILTALLCAQIKLRRWDSVRGMQKYVEETATFRPRPIIISSFAAELLRTSIGPEDVKVSAQDTFTGLLFAWENMILRNIRDELYCTLSIMSTVDHEWKAYCARFLAFSSRIAVSLSTDDFNRILSGVLDGYGSAKGKAMVDFWCHTSRRHLKPYRAPGGLPTMPQYRVTKSTEYKDRPADIEIRQASGAELILQGRITPNRQTIWAVIRKVQEEVETETRGGEEMDKATRNEKRDTLRWAAMMLYRLGYEYEDYLAGLGGLAVLAKTEGLDWHGGRDAGEGEGAEQADG
ncbi:hypothetical protein G6011_11659 [Alternaria panax]|uniref:Uncharacterized protein n=1 Tax=Alternaria panax TaxID=48097 RepID=A0AAD4NTK1_9PLEO|nr:hypothetical protein G6011_11659 [Alternaria panax]